MADNKRDGIFVNTSRRPDLKDIIKKLKAKTSIVFTADLVYQALRRWERELNAVGRGGNLRQRNHFK
jgi:hypothetical protein